MLYVNQVEPNFRMLRFAEPVHIQLGHGESDKGGSVSNQHKAYDLTFVGGEAGRHRLAGRPARLRRRAADAAGRPAAARPRLPGRPRLARDRACGCSTRPPGRATGPASRTARSPATASRSSRPSSPTRSPGDLPAAPPYRAVLRRHAAADRAIRAARCEDGDRHLVDAGGYGWQWDFADACVTDISAVAYDWLATGKPLVITEPARGRVPPAVALLDELPLLSSAEASASCRESARCKLIRNRREQLLGLTCHYFGDTSAISRARSVSRTRSSARTRSQQSPSRLI